MPGMTDSIRATPATRGQSSAGHTPPRPSACPSVDSHRTDQPDMRPSQATAPHSSRRAERKPTCAAPYQGVGHVSSPFPISGLTPRGKVVLGPVGIGDDDCGIIPGVSAPGYRDSRPSDSGWAPAVVPGQDLGEVAGAVRDGTVADLAAGDRQMVTVTGKRREGDLLICLPDATPRSDLARCPRRMHTSRQIRTMPRTQRRFPQCGGGSSHRSRIGSTGGRGGPSLRSTGRYRAEPMGIERKGDNVREEFPDRVRRLHCCRACRDEAARRRAAR